VQSSDGLPAGAGDYLAAGKGWVPRSEAVWGVGQLLLSRSRGKKDLGTESRIFSPQKANKRKARPGMALEGED